MRWTICPPCASITAQTVCRMRRHAAVRECCCGCSRPCICKVCIHAVSVSVPVLSSCPSTRSCVCKVCIHAVSHCESVSMSCEIVSRRLHVKQWHGRAQDLLGRRESREQPFLAALNVSELENLQEYRKRFPGHAVQLNQSAKGQRR